MFELTDGRSSAYQWDTGLYVDCTGLAESDEVHFCRPGITLALHPALQGEKLAAPVPDELLQQAQPIIVFAYVQTATGEITRASTRLCVIARPKPPGYIASPTEALRWGHLQKQIDELSEEISDCIKAPTTAEVGQTIVVKAIDDDGKPTEWEPVTLPEQAQPDWHQNDPTAADYVKNRPFYEVRKTQSIAGLEWVMPKVSYSSPGAVFDTPIPLEIGQTYKIKLVHDGTHETYLPSSADVYTFDTAYDAEVGKFCVGAEGVCMIYEIGIMCSAAWISANRVDSITLIGVSGEYTETVIHPLEPKYLPSVVLDLTSYTPDERTGTFGTEDAPLEMDIDNLLKVLYYGGSAWCKVNYDGENMAWSIDVWMLGHAAPGIYLFDTNYTGIFIRNTGTFKPTL